MQPISSLLNDWILNTLLEMKATLSEKEKTWTMAEIELWSTYKNTISFLESEAIKRGLSMPEIA